jgi:hypothetical protein
MPLSVGTVGQAPVLWKASIMASWRDTTSDLAQSDFDGLLNVVLPFAEQLLSARGEFFPFGSAVELDGDAVMVAADPALGERPDSNAVLDALYDGSKASRDSRRAFAFVADVRANGGDAIRIELEHHEGATLTLLVPYSLGKFKRKLTLGQMNVSVGPVRIWVT